VRVTEHYARALPDKCLGRSEAEAATAAGDEVDPVAQLEIHADLRG